MQRESAKAQRDLVKTPARRARQRSAGRSGRGAELGGAVLGSAVLLALLLSVGCSGEAAKPPGAPSVKPSLAAEEPADTSRALAAPAGQGSAAGEHGVKPARPTPKPQKVQVGLFPWLNNPDTAANSGAWVDNLEGRFPTEAGFSRVKLEPGSFGAWLRQLPLLAPGSPVKSYDGSTIRSGQGGGVSAVAALDIGQADLQQCADAIMRLHGEWRWSTGEREHSYRAASGLLLSFSRWQRGERLVAKGASLSWAPGGRARPADHGSFRKFMDAVFAWTNTVALGRQAKLTSFEQLRPGDFVVEGGNPGHAILILDHAKAADGRQAVLLGQSYMPAQSFHVLRSRSGPWFQVQADGRLVTPFWPRPFNWGQLRRLD